MYFTLLADNSVTPANIDGTQLECMGQTGVWLQTCLYLKSLCMCFSCAGISPVGFLSVPFTCFILSSL